MLKKPLTFFVFLGIVFSLLIGTRELLAQGNIKVEGVVMDSADGKPLSNVTVQALGTSKGTFSDELGQFSLDLDEEHSVLKFSFLGYQSRTISVKSDSSIFFLRVKLQSKATRQEEVVITDKRKDENVTSTAMGRIEVNMKEIKEMPVLFGEIDILKTLQMMPGVQSGGEGTTGLFVRGGNSSQNLVLLDGAPIFNTGHLMGFFSVFNGDAIRDVTLIKGEMPANYGGRLSSVVDVKMKEGNRDSIQGSGGVGLIASHFTLEGPLAKKKASFIVSGRRTYVDMLIKPFVSETSSFHGSGYYFYDLNAKLNFDLSENDHLYLSGYFGRDQFKFASSSQNFNAKIPWGNASATLHWTHKFNSRLIANTEVIYNDFDFEFSGLQQNMTVGMKSGIKDWNFKSQFTYEPNENHQIKFGGELIHHYFIPATFRGKSEETSFDPQNAFEKYGREGAIYFLDEWQIFPRMKINAGMRLSGFQQMGPYTEYQKDTNGEKIDSTVYQNRETIKTYSGWEPRLTVQFDLLHHNSLKASVTRNRQYVHMVNSNTTTLPNDLWVPSTAAVPPEKSWQYALGYYQNFKENEYETSFSVYYKKMRNQLEFSESYTPSLEDPEESFVSGKGDSYGAELFIRKQSGKLRGWLGYTLSWVWHRFPELNAGRRFPAFQDRRHDLNIVASYPVSDKWTLAADFVFQSGNPTTLPEKFYFMEGVYSHTYSRINSYRMESYHRLDFSATYDPGPKPGKKFSHSWTFSIYNVYSRFNPYFIYFDAEGELSDGSLEVQPKKVALFPILPSVSWNFKF